MCFDMHQSEKLAIFVDDARRYPEAIGGPIAIAPPHMNQSIGEFSVQQTDDGYAVRYALAGIRNVGGKAMDAIVTERDENGEFASLQDMFDRLPQGSMNRRQLEGLICAGALDTLEPNRAKLFGNADMLLAVAEAASRERNSGQGGLFGGGDGAPAELRLKDVASWSRAEIMAKERENFGFYFAGHPVEQYREAASANGARSYGSLMTGAVGAGPAQGSDARTQATMAAMVETVKRGTTKRGNDFIRAEFSDSTGQFSAACFEESLVESFVRWVDDGTCVLLTVELDQPSPDEPPRITVRGARPLDEVQVDARMVMTLDILGEAGLADLKLALAPGKPGHGEVTAQVVSADGTRAAIRLGADFALDGDLAERLASVSGLANVQINSRRAARHLRLVA